MRFRAHLIGASALLLLAIWLSSGTMAPYASTWAFPIVSKPCGYLYNLDHPQHLAVFQMLDGQPREVWQGSFVLRRLLFPAIRREWPRQRRSRDRRATRERNLPHARSIQARNRG